MFRVFFKGDNVPKWMFNVSVYTGGKAPEIKFSGFNIVYKIKGRVNVKQITGKSMITIDYGHSCSVDFDKNITFKQKTSPLNLLRLIKQKLKGNR